MTDKDAGVGPVECMVRTDAYRCIAPVCKPLGCSDCNCAVPADVYAALGAAFQAEERERCARLCEANSAKWDRIGGDGGASLECADAIRGA